MNEEAAVERFAVVMWVTRAVGRMTAGELSAALLPVVREIAAEELREAARGAATGTWRAPITGEDVAAMLHARADALTKPPDGPAR